MSGRWHDAGVTTPETLPTTNWCDTATLATPASSYAVADAAQAAALFAERPGARIQVLGSRFSYPTLIDGNDGIAVHLRTIGSKVVAMDACSVTVTADCTLTELWEHVREWGLTLPVCPPVITEQTVAGALATGTHAQGLGEGLLADTVEAVAYVDAEGREREARSGDDDFGAFLLHLGTLGMLTRVTFRLQDNRRYHCAKYTTTGGELLSGFEAWNHRSAHVKAWWWVDEDRAHVWEVNPVGAAAVSAGAEDAHTDLNAILAATQARLGDDTGEHSNDAAPQRTVGRFYDYADVEGDLVEIFRNGIPAPQINMEVGVPLDRFADAAADLRQAILASPFRMHYPVILRPTGPSEAWLAAAYERATVWFGFVVYQRPDGTVAEGSVDLLADIQRALARHDGLPHWGKYFDETLFDLRGLPRLTDFRAVRDRVDPQRRFLAPRVAQVLGI